MSTSDEPDWTALPYAPRRFLELPDDFDRVELRRKYSALIRRFKPEKFPDEFRRIRSAFEELDQELRASRRQTPHAPPLSNFQAPLFEVSRHPETLPSHDEDKPSHAETEPSRSKSEPPRDGPKPSRRKAKPRAVDSTEQLEASLHGLAHRLRSDLFYREAWPIWEQLTAIEPFERWQPLLTELSRIVDGDTYDQPPVEKVEFFVNFLRRGLWVASDEWLNEAFEFLDNNADLVREPWDYEFLLRLDDYRDDREGFLNGTRARQLIDEAIRDWCLLSCDEAARTFRRHQAELAAHPEWLREAFPIGDADMAMHWGLWEWISKDTCSRLRIASPFSASAKISLQHLFEQAAEAIRLSAEFTSWQEIDSRASLAANLGNVVGATMIGLFAFGISGFTMFAIFGRVLPGPVVLIVPICIGVVVLVVAASRGKSVLLTERTSPTRPETHRHQERQLAQSCYERHLTPLFDALVQQTSIPFQNLVELSRQELEATAMTLRQGLPFVRWIHHLMATDYALACLATARPFL